MFIFGFVSEYCDTRECSLNRFVLRQVACLGSRIWSEEIKWQRGDFILTDCFLPFRSILTHKMMGKFSLWTETVVYHYQNNRLWDVRKPVEPDGPLVVTKVLQGSFQVSLWCILQHKKSLIIELCAEKDTRPIQEGILLQQLSGKEMPFCSGETEELKQQRFCPGAVNTKHIVM